MLLCVYVCFSVSRRQTCVRPGVSLQLVAACETFPTENPVADEGPFASVKPNVSSEQRRFPERLLAAGDMADVLPLPYLPRPTESRHTNMWAIVFMVELTWKY